MDWAAEQECQPPVTPKFDFARKALRAVLLCMPAASAVIDPGHQHAWHPGGTTPSETGHECRQAGIGSEGRIYPHLCRKRPQELHVEIQVGVPVPHLGLTPREPGERPWRFIVSAGNTY